MIDLAQYARLPRSFFADADTQAVAQRLLGKTLVVAKHGVVKAGRIVETEAYLGPHDLAAHSSKGLTPRTKAMFGEAGHAYIYLIYGMYHCMNTVTGPVGSGSGVLLRALEPLQNIDALTNGPGKLCRAMGIDKSDYGADLCLGKTIYVLDSPSIAAENIVAGPRVGIKNAGAWITKPLRFYEKNNCFVSKK